MIWTRQKMVRLIMVAKGCDNLKQISDEFFKAEGVRLSGSAIRSALERHTDVNVSHIKRGGPFPKIFLEDAPADSVKSSVRVERTANSASPQLAKEYPDWQHENGVPPEIPEGVISSMKLMYASKSSGGLGMTAFEVAVALQDAVEGPLTEAMVRDILKEVGQTKNSIPDMISQNMDMIREERESLKRKVMSSGEYQRSYIKSLEKRINELESYEELKQLALGDKTFQAKRINTLSGPMNSSNSVLIFPVSDVHSGAVWNALKDNKHYQKQQIEYNARVMDERQGRLQHAWVKMLQTPHTTIGEVHYLSLGDDLEGLYANLRGGQFLDQDSFEYQQFSRARDFHLNNILFLISCCGLKKHRPKIRVTFTPGNHDRLYQDKSYNSENFMAYLLADLVSTNHMLRTAISEYGVDLVEIAAAVPMISYLYEGINVCLLAHHGHLFNVKTDKDIHNLAHVHGVSNAKRYVMVQAHLHHFKAVQASECKYIYNPSYCGNTGYSSVNIQKGAPAQAIGILIDDTNDLILGPYELS